MIDTDDFEGLAPQSAKVAKVAKVSTDNGTSAGVQRLLWMLSRLQKADDALYGEPMQRPDSWWDAGAVWARGSDRRAIHFAAFCAGVALGHENPASCLEVLSRFRAKFGDEAGDWLHDVWRDLEGVPDNRPMHEVCC